MIRFTLFNAITLFIFALTVWMAAVRLRGRTKTAWAALYYLLAAGYTFGFDGSLNRWWLVAGVLSAAVLRAGIARGRIVTFVRAIELVFLGYALLRCLQLLVMWPW